MALLIQKCVIQQNASKWYLSSLSNRTRFAFLIKRLRMKKVKVVSLRKLYLSGSLSDSQANVIFKTLKVYKLKINVLICRNTGLADVFCQYSRPYFLELFPGVMVLK